MFFKKEIILILLFLFSNHIWGGGSGPSYYPTGVDESAISIPKEEVTISGIGGEYQTLRNSGRFSYSINIEVPNGVNKHVPKLALGYNSAGGQGVFGRGWSLNIPTVERSTLRGTPSYSQQDLFWGAEGELVSIDIAGEENTYAHLINKDQSIYFYDDINDTWIQRLNNGVTRFYGESANDKVVTTFGSFKWSLSREVDPYGNEIVYEYFKEDGRPYLSKVSYAYKNSLAHYFVEFSYEVRSDDRESFLSSEEVILKKRCSSITVKSNPDYVIRKYNLSYVSASLSEYSLLKSVKKLGENETDTTPVFPPVTFNYSDFEISNLKSEKMIFNGSSFPPSLKKKRATLIDINRDSLPDILETSRYGAKVWVNKGDNTFENSYTMSDIVSVLGEGHGKLLDVDGDRVVDFVGGGLYPKYLKGGVERSDGKIGFDPNPLPISAIPKYSLNAANVKTIDLNGDGRLDIMARDANKFSTYISTSSGNWKLAESLPVATHSFDLSSRYTFFDDINGDGLVDIVFVRSNLITYIANLGNGNFSTPKTLDFVENSPKILDYFFNNNYNFISDINGDGRGDLLSVFSTFVAFSLNLGNGSFGETQIIDNIHSESFSDKGLHITMGDMNGNGSSDILWTNDFHDYRYLDFRSLQPYLLTSIDNGLGHKITVNYSLALHEGEHALAEESIMPFPYTVVSHIKEYLKGGSELISENEYHYYGGFYDGDLNETMGFSLVDQIEWGDLSIPSVLKRTQYNQGRNLSQTYLRGMPTSEIIQQIITPSMTLGEIFFQRNYSLESISTFNSNAILPPKRPHVYETWITEGDGNPSTLSRTHKEKNLLTMSVDGVVESEKITIFDDQDNVHRSEEKYFAIQSYFTNFLGNRVCETYIKDATQMILSSEHYYYDNQTTLCNVDKGSITQRAVWNGSAYESRESFSYILFGALSSITDALSHTTGLTYGAKDIFVASVTNGAGHTKSATYNYANGMLSAITDENSRTTQYFFDPFLRVNKVVGPADSPSLPTLQNYYYFGNSLVDSFVVTEQIVDSGQNDLIIKKKFFDGKGRSRGELKVVNQLGEMNFTGGVDYNRNGETYRQYFPVLTMDFSSVPSFNDSFAHTKSLFDILGREVTRYNPEHTISIPSKVEILYNVGETQVTDELGRITINKTDFLGNVIEHVDAHNISLFYEYDERNNLSKITDSEGNETLFTYDFENRRVCKLDPTLGVSLYSYNAAGLLTSKSNYGFVSGQTTCDAPASVTPRKVSFEYNDGLNRRTKIDYPTGSLTEDIVYTYDDPTSSYGIGKLTGVDFGGGSKVFQYDIYDNESSQALTLDGTTYTTKKEYYAIGAIKTMTYPSISGASGLEIDYGLDFGGRPLTITNTSASSNLIGEVTYNPREQVTAITFGSGAQSTKTYDEVGKSFNLLNTSTTVPAPLWKGLAHPVDFFNNGFKSTTISQNINYSYDLAKNITAREDVTNTFSENFTYDDLDRLTSADLNLVETRNYTFDHLGNLTSLEKVTSSTETTNYIYESNRDYVLASVGSSNYAFDNFGDIIGDGERNFIFNWNHQLISVTKDSVTTTYSYDENGMRVKKTNPFQTSYFIDKYTEIRGANVIRYIFLPTPEGREIRVASVDQSGTTTYNHEDHLTSSSIRTDASGSVIEARSYYPYGDTRVSSSTASIPFLNRYTDQYEDLESGLYYYKKRYYNSKLGRFISPDPLYSEEMDERGTNSQELNLYVYVRNNPLKYNDPFGLFTVFAGRGAGGGAGLGVRFSSGSWLNYDSGRNFNPTSGGTYNTYEVGANYGVSAGVGIESGFVTGKVSDFSGKSVVSGFSGGALANGGFDFSLTSTREFGFSMSIELGTGAAGYQRVSHTAVSFYDQGSFMSKFISNVIDNVNDFYNKTFGSSGDVIDNSTDSFTFGNWSFQSNTGGQ